VSQWEYTDVKTENAGAQVSVYVDSFPLVDDRWYGWRRANGGAEAPAEIGDEPKDLRISNLPYRGSADRLGSAALWFIWCLHALPDNKNVKVTMTMTVLSTKKIRSM
jgi:hypothetical protein